MKGWRTLIVAAVTAVAGVAATFDWTTVLNGKGAGIALIVVGVVNAVLRAFTDTPVGSSTPN